MFKGRERINTKTNICHRLALMEDGSLSDWTVGKEYEIDMDMGVIEDDVGINHSIWITRSGEDDRDFNDYYRRGQMMSKTKYQVGDTFPATIRIKEVDNDLDMYSDAIYLLEVVELKEEVAEGYLTESDLDQAFDEHYAKRKKIKEIAELEEKLKKMKSDVESS